MIGMLIVARILGPNVMGIVAFGLAFVSMFLLVSDFGLGSAHIKLISEGQDEAKCIGTFARLKLLFILFYVLIVLSFYLGQKYIFNVTFESSDHEYVILIYLLLTAISQLYVIPSTTFAAKTEQAKQDIPNFIQILLYQIFRVIAAFLGYKAIAQSVSNLAAVILVLPIYFYLFKGYPIGKFDKPIAKKYFNISIPIFIVLISQTIIYSSDKVILQYMTNTDEVGFYSAGFSMSQFIRLIETSAGILFFPFFSKNIAEGEYDKITENIKKYEKFNFSFVLPFVFYLIVFADFIVLIMLGHKFYKTPPMLAIITNAMFVSLVLLPYANVITGKGLFKLSALINISGTVIFIILSIILVSPLLLNLKGIGISISLLITNIFFCIIFIFFAKRNLNTIEIFTGKYLFLYGIIYMIITLLIYNNLSLDMVGKVVASIIYFLGYFIFAYFLKLITIEDWKKMLEMIDIKKMFKYINSELKNK